MAKTKESRLSCKILESYARAIWKKQGHSGDPPIPTPDELWEWMPPFNSEAYSRHIHKIFFEIGILVISSGDRPPENPPDAWEDRAWFHFTRCFYQHGSDVPIAGAMASDDDHVINSAEITPRVLAYAGMYKLFTHDDNTLKKEFNLKMETIDDAIEAIHSLWNAVHAKHPDKFSHPLAPIIETWLTDQMPKVKPEQRSSQITPSFLKETRIVKADPVLPIGEMHTQAPQTLMLPGFEPENSALVPALPLEIYGTGAGAGRGAPLDERIWMNALTALPFGVRDRHGLPDSVRLTTTLRDIVAWLYPKGWNRTNQLPLIRKALYEVHNKRIAYERRDWSVVQVLALPNSTTKLDDPLPFSVRLPDGVSGNGPMIDVETMRLYGTESAPKFRAWIRLAYLWDEAKKRNGGYRIYATIPEVLRNNEGFLTYSNGDVILSSKPKMGKDGRWQVGNGKQPQTAWYHPWATPIGTERNPQGDKVPVLSDSDMVLLFFDDSEVNRATFRDRLRIARKTATEMEAEGKVIIERDTIDHKRGVKGWRILEVRKPKVLSKSL